MFHENPRKPREKWCVSPDGKGKLIRILFSVYFGGFRGYPIVMIFLAGVIHPRRPLPNRNRAPAEAFPKQNLEPVDDTSLNPDRSRENMVALRQA